MEQSTRRRRRPALSCLECRRRKIKCDRTEPCKHCVSSKLQCTYRTYSREPAIQQPSQRGNSWGTPTSPPVQANSPAAQTLEINSNRGHKNNGDILPDSRAVHLALPRRSTPNSLDGNTLVPPNPALDPEPNLRHLLQRILRVEKSLASSPISGQFEASHDDLAQHSDSRVMLKKTRIWRWSDWMGEAQEFQTVFDCYKSYINAGTNGEAPSFNDTETEALAVQAGNLIHECKNLARNIKRGRPSRSLASPKFSLQIPDRETADKMTNLYLSSFESTHRILHVPTFWADYQKYWASPETATNELRLKTLLVIGIGSSLHDPGEIDTGFRDMVLQWVYAAQMWLSGPLEKDRLSINGLQVHCLTILARQIFSVGGDLIWLSMGSLFNIAMQIGLHRDPKYLPTMSTLHAEIRRRLWATILEFAVQSSLDSAMPPRISFNEFDTEAPSNINDDEINESTTELQPHPKTNYTETSLQLILLDSLPIRLRVLQLLNGLHSDLSYNDVLALDLALTDAYRAKACFLRRNDHHGVSTFHRNVLDLLLRRFMIPLHCPFASKARTNPLFHYSLKAGLDAAMAIVSPEPDDRFSHLMKVAGGLFKEGIRYATSMIGLEFIAQTEARRLDGTLHCNTRHRDALKQAMEDTIEIYAERLRRGETNIKGHLFLSMMMAQAEAIEAGTQGDLKMAQSAKESLEFSLAILKAQADNVSSPSPYIDNQGLGSYGFEDVERGLGLDWDLEFFPDTDFSASYR